MGVNQANYIIAGKELDFSRFDYDSIEDFMVSYWEEPKKDSLQIIYDGMCGDYILAGFILASTNEDRSHFGDAPIPIDLNDELKSKICEAFKEGLELEVEPTEIKVFAVTHHS